MANGRDFDSYIFRKGVSPNTLSVISSKNRVFAFNAGGEQKQIGVISTFDPSEARTVEPVRGIGFGDHVAELVPGVTDPMTISVTRTALYLSNIMQVFGYKAGVDGITRSLKHHRWPFDVWQEVVFSTIAKMQMQGNSAIIQNGLIQQLPPPKGETVEGTGSESAANSIGILTIYEACWMSDYSVSFASDTAIVQETVTLNVSDILAGTQLDPYYGEIEPYSNLHEGGKGLSNRLTGLGE